MEALKPPKMHVDKDMCLNPQGIFGVVIFLDLLVDCLSSISIEMQSVKPVACATEEYEVD